MTIKEIFVIFIIYLFVPVAGLIHYIILTNKMKRENVANPPTIELFIIYSTYGGLLLVALTTIFWKWSGIASLGTFYLILGAPIAMGIICFRIKKVRRVSQYHDLTYKAGLSYFAIAPVTILLLVLFSGN